MMESNFSNFTERKPLFPGLSSNQSPANHNSDDSQELSDGEKDQKTQHDDQLGKIFDVIGTPSPDQDISDFCGDETALKYLRSFKPRDPVDLSVVYPGVESQGIALLKKMLEFNPNNRITAVEALQDSYFDEVRLPNQENCGEVPVIHIDVDDKGEEEAEMSKLIDADIEAFSSQKFDFENDFEEENGEDY